jgi:hypothetical protein
MGDSEGELINNPPSIVSPTSIDLLRSDSTSEGSGSASAGLVRPFEWSCG